MKKETTSDIYFSLAVIVGIGIIVLVSYLILDRWGTQSVSAHARKTDYKKKAERNIEFEKFLILIPDSIKARLKTDPSENLNFRAKGGSFTGDENQSHFELVDMDRLTLNEHSYLLKSGWSSTNRYIEDILYENNRKITTTKLRDLVTDFIIVDSYRARMISNEPN